VKVLGVPGTAGADAEPGVGSVGEPPAEDPLDAVAAGDAAVDEAPEMDPLDAVAAGDAAVDEAPEMDPLDAVAAGDAAVDEAPEMMDDASDGEMVRVLVL